MKAPLLQKPPKCALAALLLASWTLSAAELPSKVRLDDAVRLGQQRLQADVHVWAKNLQTGAVYEWRAGERVRTASTIKLPILAALHAKIARGELKWTDEAVLRRADKVSGSGVIQELSNGVRLPLRDLANLMIVVSDNTATNMLLDRVSSDEVNAFLDTLGLTQTRSMRKVRGDGKQLAEASGWSKAGLIEENRRFGLGVTTMSEMGRLAELLAAGKVVSPEASREIVTVLERQQYKDGIGRRLGELKVASKSGALDALRSDVGIVTTQKGTVILAITVDGMKKVDYSEDNEGLVLIAELARLLVAALTE